MLWNLVLKSINHKVWRILRSYSVPIIICLIFQSFPLKTFIIDYWYFLNISLFFFFVKYSIVIGVRIIVFTSFCNIHSLIEIKFQNKNKSKFKHVISISLSSTPNFQEFDIVFVFYSTKLISKVKWSVL